MYGMCNNMYRIVKLVLCGSCQLYVTLGVLPAICLVMLLAGENRVVPAVRLVCVAVWRPFFMRVMLAVHIVMLLLSGDHPLCMSCQQYVKWMLSLYGDHVLAILYVI